MPKNVDLLFKKNFKKADIASVQIFRRTFKHLNIKLLISILGNVCTQHFTGPPLFLNFLKTEVKCKILVPKMFM